MSEKAPVGPVTSVDCELAAERADAIHSELEKWIRARDRVSAETVLLSLREPIRVIAGRLRSMQRSLEDAKAADANVLARRGAALPLHDLDTHDPQSDRESRADRAVVNSGADPADSGEISRFRAFGS